MSDRGDRIERLLSIAVGLAAITAVLVSLYQASLARQQLRASAWPYVTQSNSFTTGNPYVRSVSNEGIGPARVRSFDVLVDGKPVTSWNAAVLAFTGDRDGGLVYSSFGRGSVLTPGTKLPVLMLPAGPVAQKFWQSAQTRLRTVVCYCSVYDECWSSDSEGPEPQAVRACSESAGLFPR